ncbi:MAG: GNAT family N-acetyltransferase [Sphingobacteriales bacterium]
MEAQLKNGQKASIRLLNDNDTQKLFSYLSSLSSETKSRFSPHSFDWQTVENICTNLDDVMRYVALEAAGEIIAYMLFKQGMIEWDGKRYAERNQYFIYHTTVTYAPSVADGWQNSGLGTMMHRQIESVLKSKGIQHIILWGGVQVANERAMNFYKKLGYLLMGSFRHNEMDNQDMMKQLE